MVDEHVVKIKEFEAGLIEYTERHAKAFYKEVTESKMWTEKGEEQLKKAIGEFKLSFVK